MNKTIIVGADEAGRGLIIGPMVIAACAIDERLAGEFLQEGFKDSKNYHSVEKLYKHAELIKTKSLAWSLKVITARTLTNFHKDGLTMDEVEAYAFFRAIESIAAKVGKITTFQVDNFQAVKTLRRLLKQSEVFKETKLIVCAKADAKYIAVSAASVLARAKVLTELERIRKQFGDFGSGSTSDSRTICWLRNYFQKYRTWPVEIVRVHWKTIKEIEEDNRF